MDMNHCIKMRRNSETEYFNDFNELKSYWGYECAKDLDELLELIRQDDDFNLPEFKEMDF